MDKTTDCPICLSTFTSKDIIVICWECFQKFHLKCLEKSLLTTKTCPCCRTAWNNENTTGFVLK